MKKLAPLNTLVLSVSNLLPVLMGFVLLLLSSTEGWSADLQKGLAAHRSGDYTTALRELRPFAEQGDVDAQFVLGVMYGEGKGVTQNYKTALKWYTLAAEQGNAKAQTLLGFVYSLGEGVIQDYARSHMWFNIAASSGESKQASKSRDFVAKRMTRAQIAEAQRLARECVRKKYKGC